MRILLSLLMAASCYAGQYLDLDTQEALSTSLATQSINNSFSVEGAFSYTDTNLGMSGIFHVTTVDAVGFDAEIIWTSASDIRLQMTASHQVGGAACQMRIETLAGLLTQKVRFRFVRDVVGGLNTCQLTDINGNQLVNSTYAIGTVSGSNSTAALIKGGGTGENIHWDYLVVRTIAVSTTGKPPTTAGDLANPPVTAPCSASDTNHTGLLLDWKFDFCNGTGTLTDLSGNGYTASLSPASPSPVYGNSTGQVAFADISPVVISTIANNHLWCQNYSTFSCIAWDTTGNNVNQIDCSGSYSQTDLSDQVTCGWSSLSGPTTPTFTGSNQPIVTNLADTRPAHVDYNIQLVATDTIANTGTATMHFGAIPMNANGIVQNASWATIGAKVDTFFGPMIALGYNPWGYGDERHAYAVSTGQVAVPNGSNIAGYNASALWTTTGTGTVTYPFNGQGGFSCTTLTAGITATATSIAVADASCLTGLSSLPTGIYIGFVNGRGEYIRICSTTGTTGAQTLTACYDGRGISDGFSAQLSLLPAQSWLINAEVGEYRIAGSGTKFVTDSARPICPGGAPGPPGAVLYSTGTVAVVHNTTTITGTGVTWPTSFNGGMVKVAGTTTSGTPFAFWRKITAVPTSSTLTIDHAYPSTADDLSGLSYYITSPRYISLDFCTDGSSTCNEGDAVTARGLQSTEYCESETAAYAIYAHDVVAFDGLTFTGVKYSYKLGVGNANNPNNGPNFYGSGLAARYFWLRSGLTLGYSNANLIDELWINDPDNGSGWFMGSSPLSYAGGVQGTVADLITNSTTILKWTDITHLGSNYADPAAYGVGCNVGDTRDTGAKQGFVNMLALFDPDGTRHTTWQSGAAGWYGRDVTTSQPITSSTGCKGSDNSWGNASTASSTTPTVNVTQVAQGSTASSTVTANTGVFSAGSCQVTASGTATLSNGSNALSVVSGSFTSGGSNIVIVGTTSGGTVTSSLSTSYSFGSSSAVTIGGLWFGDTGTVTWAITDTTPNFGADNLTFASSTDDPRQIHQQVCKFTDTTHVEIFPPWTMASASNLLIYKSNGNAITGYFQQPFMLGGYKSEALRWGSLNSDPTIAANYAALLPLAATWIHDRAFDSQSLSVDYARLGDFYEPRIVASSALLTWKQQGSQVGANPSDIGNQRNLNAEASTGIAQYYIANLGNSAALLYGDQAYGAVFGYCPWTLASYYCDANYVTDLLSNANLSGYKYTGFNFGAGRNEQWPAIRLQSSDIVSGLAIGGKYGIGGRVGVNITP